MNTRSFERDLRQIEAPVPDPAARAQARREAVAEFERQQAQAAAPARSRLVQGAPWTGLLAAACAVVAVAIYWQLPEAERALGTSAVAVDARDPTAVREALAASRAIDETSPDAAPVITSTTQHEMAERPTGPALATAAPTAVKETAADRGQLAAVPPAALPDAPPAVADLESVVPVPGSAYLAGDRSNGVLLADLAAGQLFAGNAGLMPSRAPGVVQSVPLIDRQGTSSGPVFASSSAQTGITAAVSIAAAGSELRRAISAPATAARNFYGPPGGYPFAPPVPQRRGDQFTSFDANPVRRVAEEPVSTFSLDVDTASYSFARRALQSGVLPPADAVRAEEMINYFAYEWPAAESRNRPFRPTVTVSDSPWTADRKLVHIGIRGYELPARQRPDANLVLLLDVSGSMDAPDRLPLVKQSMRLLLNNLRPTDTVSIAVYAGAAGEVLAPTPVRERDRIEAALDGLVANGSTAGAQGITLAYELARRNFRKEGVNRILLATDGDFNVGVTSMNELQALVARERSQGIYLSVLGFGSGNYRDDIAQTLAQNGNGVAAYIDTLAEARKVLAREATSSIFPIADDVKVQVEFNPATVAEYRLIGYETRALAREDFNNDQVDAGEVGSGRAVTAIYEITPVGVTPSTDERRYAGVAARPHAPQVRKEELGFVKIRYKLPGGKESRLIEEAIRVDTGVPQALRHDVAFSTAVAGFAQLLRGGSQAANLRYSDVLSLAESGLGPDVNGDRAGFLELVRTARSIGARDMD